MIPPASAGPLLLIRVTWCRIPDRSLQNFESRQVHIALVMIPPPAPATPSPSSSLSTGPPPPSEVVSHPVPAGPYRALPLHRLRNPHVSLLVAAVSPFLSCHLVLVSPARRRCAPVWRPLQASGEPTGWKIPTPSCRSPACA